MAKPDCVTKVAEKLKLGQFETEKLRELEDVIHDLMDYYVDPKTKQVDRASIQKEFEKVLEDWKVDTKTEAAATIANRIKEERARRHLLNGDFKKSFLNFLNFFEGNNSIETFYRSDSTHYSKMLHSRLKDENLTKVFYRGELDELVFEQAYRKSKGMDDVNDPRAVKAHEIIQELNNKIWQDHRLAGLNVRYRKDFLISRSYNAEKMLGIVEGNPQASKEAWIDEMLENYLNHEETFTKASRTIYDDKTGKVIKAGKEREILGQMWEDIMEANRKRPAKDSKGKKNYLNRLKGRKIEFKDGKTEYEFMRKYGNSNSLIEGMQYNIDRSAKASANVRMLGTNAERTYQGLMETFTKDFQGKVSDAEISRAVSKIQKAYEEVVAPPHAPSTFLEKSVNFMRGLSAFTKLGSSIFSALWDVNSSAAMYFVRTGESQIKGYVDAWFNTVKFAASPEQLKEMGDALNANIWFNDMAIAMGGHKGDYDTGYNLVNNAFNYMGKFTGVPYQTKISRVVNSVLQAKSFQKMIDNVGKLNNFQKIAMEEYGITADDLKFLGKYAKKHDSIGAITPNSVYDIPLEKFGKDRGSALNAQKELFYKISNYIDDAVQKGTPTPTAKTKRQLFKSRSENELRVLANLTMQFKETAWQILIANKEILEKSYQANGVVGAGRFVGEYMALGLISYMGIEYLKAKLFNKDDPFEKFARGGDDAKQVFIDYINKTSIAPVISDAVTAATSPYPLSNLTSYIAGPSMATMSELGKIPVAKDQTRAGMKFARRHLLPMNHFTVKALERHLFNYEWLTGDRIRK